MDLVSEINVYIYIYIYYKTITTLYIIILVWKCLDKFDQNIL